MKCILWKTNISGKGQMWIIVWRFTASMFRIFLQAIFHSYLYRLPTLVGISKTILDKSLGLTQYKQDFKNEVHTKRSYIHKIIIPRQIVENPNFKPILVVKVWQIFLWFLCRTKYICMLFTVTTAEINKYTEKHLFVDECI